MLAGLYEHVRETPRTDGDIRPYRGIFGLLGVLRAVFAIMKQRWLFSIVGTIFVIISRFMAIVPFVFGKIAPILIALEGTNSVVNQMHRF